MIGPGDQIVTVKRHWNIPKKWMGHVVGVENYWLGRRAEVWFPQLQKYKMVPLSKVYVTRKYVHPVYVPGPNWFFGDYVHVAI